MYYKFKLRCASAVAGVILVLGIASPTIAASAVEAAYAFCSAMDGTGLTSGCSVEVNFTSANTVDLIVDMSSSEARKLCGGLPQAFSAAGPHAQQGLRALRGGGWELRILSPYGVHPIAKCGF